MLTVGMLVANRYDTMAACIKKYFSDRGKLRFISELKNFSALNEYLSTLAQNGDDIVVADILGTPEQSLGGLFFDVIIYDNMSGAALDGRNMAKYIHPKTIVLSNGDDGDIPDFMLGGKLCTITYGLSHKCSVTPSSIDNSDGLRFHCCIQRRLPSVSGAETEIGEYPVAMEGSSINIYDALAAATLFMVLR